jgi:hypothetical protein
MPTAKQRVLHISIIAWFESEPVKPETAAIVVWVRTVPKILVSLGRSHVQVVQSVIVPRGSNTIEALVTPDQGFMEHCAVVLTPRASTTVPLL